MNNTSIPPIITINRMYENQKLWESNPVIMAIRIACISKVNPIDRGCLRNMKVNDIVNVNVINDWIIQRIVYENFNFGD